MRYECVMCDIEFEAAQPAKTCGAKCRKRYQRYLEKGGVELDVTPMSRHVTPDVTPIERLYNEPVASNQILLEILAELKTLNARLATPTMTVNIPLGSGYVPNVALPDIEPPQVIFDEAAAKARSIANTLAAMADF